MIQRQKLKKALVAVVTLLVLVSVWTEMRSEVLVVDLEMETMCKCKRKQQKILETK